MNLSLLPNEITMKIVSHLDLNTLLRLYKNGMLSTVVVSEIDRRKPRLHSLVIRNTSGYAFPLLPESVKILDLNNSSFVDLTKVGDRDIDITGKVAETIRVGDETLVMLREIKKKHFPKIEGQLRCLKIIKCEFEDWSNLSNVDVGILDFWRMHIDQVNTMPHTLHCPRLYDLYEYYDDKENQNNFLGLRHALKKGLQSVHIEDSIVPIDVATVVKERSEQWACDEKKTTFKFVHIIRSSF